MVQLHRAAHHAGNIKDTIVPIVKRLKGNPNHYSIGIECADEREPYSADRSKQLPEVAKLVARLAKEYDIPLDRNHIVGHREIFAAKGCPGNINVDRLLQMAINQEDKKNEGVSVDDKKLADGMKALLERYKKGSVEDFDEFLVKHIGQEGQGGYLASLRHFERQLKDELLLPQEADKNTILKRVETLIQEIKNQPERPITNQWPLPSPSDVKINGLEVTIDESGKTTTKVNYEVK